MAFPEQHSCLATSTSKVAYISYFFGLWTCWLCCAGKTIYTSVSANLSTSEVRVEVHKLQQYIRQKEKEIQIMLRGYNLQLTVQPLKIGSYGPKLIWHLGT